MDAVYQAIKNLLKAFINLFVAIVELFAGIINGAASLFRKLSPGEWGLKGKNTGEKLKTGSFAVTGKMAADAELVSKVRIELNEKIKDRDTYILTKAEVEIFENNRMRNIFSGRKRKLTHAVAKILLEEEFKDKFSKENELLEVNEVKMNGFTEDKKESIPESGRAETEENTPEAIESEEPSVLSVEKAKIQSICEVGKEAIS